MSRSLALSLAASFLSLVAAAPALAADVAVYEDPAPAAAVSNTDVVIELGLGGRISPKYEGSKEYEVSPFPIIGLGYLNIPGVLEIGSLSPQGGGLSIGPSFGYTGERESRDYSMSCAASATSMPPTRPASSSATSGRMPRSTAPRATPSAAARVSSARSAPI